MLSVVLGRTTPVYSPGEVLTGDVVLSVTAQCSILDLTVNYCGISSVSFLYSEGDGKSRKCDKVEETDIHLDVLHPLIKSYRGEVKEVGVHTYSFNLTLPQLLPSSYQSPYGHVSYYVHVHLQTSTSTMDVRKPFVIRAPVNINLFISSQKPLCAEVAKKYGLISNKTVRLKASVSKTCFVPGDVIQVLVEVSNDTARELRYLFCTLKQMTNVLVHLQDRTVNRVTKQCLVTVAHKVTGDKVHCSWLCQLPSPTTLAPTIAASTIVFVTYTVQVCAKIKRVPIPPEVQIPVVFGVRAPVIQQQESQPSVTRRVSEQPYPRSQELRRSSSTLLLPTVFNSQPRHRRVTISSQPQLSPTNPTRRISSHLQAIASNLTHRISSQLQTSFPYLKQPLT